MSNLELCRRVEEASLNAWPALQQSLFDGWVLRFSRGFTKRANSIVPLYPATLDPLEKIPFCESLYAKAGLKTIFRLTTVVDSMALDATLESRGYARVDPTLVQVLALGDTRPNRHPGFTAASREAWLDAYARMATLPAVGQQLHALLLDGIRTDHVFGIVGADGAPAACGLAVLERELVGLFDIVTHPTARRRGHARALVESLLNWGRDAGARCAYLQVVEANTAGRALWRRLGFVEAYRYWYRVAP